MSPCKAMRPMALCAALVVAAALAAAPARAQDPVALHPENYTVLLENDEVRVMEFRLARGARERMHAHPANVVYVLAPFRIRFTFPDGRTVVREARAGEVLHNREPAVHAPENIGDTDARGLIVEMKRPATPAGRLTAVTFIEGRPEEAAELREALLAITPPTRAEPANLLYDLYVSPEQPHRFMRFEVWTDDQGLEDHKRTAHFERSFAKRREKGWATEITRWRRIGP